MASVENKIDTILHAVTGDRARPPPREETAGSGSDMEIEEVQARETEPRTDERRREIRVEDRRDPIQQVSRPRLDSEGGSHGDSEAISGKKKSKKYNELLGNLSREVCSCCAQAWRKKVQESQVEVRRKGYACPGCRKVFDDGSPEGVVSSHLLACLTRRRRDVVDIGGGLVLPNYILAVLKPHQVEAVRFLWHCLFESGEDEGGGVLADDLGLGKTLSAIAILVLLRSSKYKESYKRIMVLCPAVVLGHWEAEMSKVYIIWNACLPYFYDPRPCPMYP